MSGENKFNKTRKKSHKNLTVSVYKSTNKVYKILFEQNCTNVGNYINIKGPTIDGVNVKIHGELEDILKI